MRVITQTAELKALCRKLAEEPYITVDTEFLRDTTYWPRLCLIQMAGTEDAVIVDPLSNGLDLDPFFELMTAPALKVFHAARQDIEIVHYLSGRIPQPLFDTQVAAMVCGFGDQVGYETLIKKTSGAEIDKSSRFTDWGRRPLSERQLAYALSDVTHLRGAYEVLRTMLERNDREGWVAEEMAVLTDPATYRLDPEEAWQRLRLRNAKPKTLAVLREVAAWREREARARDVPRNRVLKDDALMEIALHPPGRPEDIDQLRAVPNGFSRSRSARGLLDAVKAGLETPREAAPKLPRPPFTPPGMGPTVELLKVLLKIICEEKGVAQKLIATSADLERIAADDNADVPALQGWRREVFGEAALRLKHGHIALGLRDGQVMLIERKDET